MAEHSKVNIPSPSRMQLVPVVRAIRVLAMSFMLAMIFLSALEVVLKCIYLIRNELVDYVVLPYNAAHDFGPVPPWIDGRRIMQTDEKLMWRNRENVSERYLDVFTPVINEQDRNILFRQFIPDLPHSLKKRPVWEVVLNSQGFRSPEFRAKKLPGTFRIVALGDSWTFGANVNQNSAYPQALSRLLAERHPSLEIETLNLGVMGYSSEQGLRLLRSSVLALEPDLVIIGFGMNDASVVGWRDKDHVGIEQKSTLGVKDFVRWSEIYRLLSYITALWKYEHTSIGQFLRSAGEVVGTQEEAWIGRQGNEIADYRALEPYTRVSPSDYEDNIRKMVLLLRERGTGVILLFNELWNTPYREALRRVSISEEVPLIDSKSIIDCAKAETARNLERQLGLKPPLKSRHNGEDIEVIFRVYDGGFEVRDHLYIAGLHPALGNGEPNRVALFDDGSHGDQRAGDRVWSLAVRLPPGRTILYVYTNSGSPGRWEGVDVPEIRRLTTYNLESGQTVYHLIETFGDVYMQADGWHTNAAGYDLIAKAVLEEIGKHRKFAEFSQKFQIKN